MQTNQNPSYPSNAKIQNAEICKMKTFQSNFYKKKQQHWQLQALFQKMSTGSQKYNSVKCRSRGMSQKEEMFDSEV